MFLKRTLAAAAIVLGTAAAANAADIPMTPVAPPPPPPAPVFDWSGPYVGAYTGWMFGPGLLQTGVQAGYLFDMGGFVAGVEAQLGADFAFPGVLGEANLNARAGYAFNQLLLYAEAGVGILYPVVWTWNAGGGVEYALDSGISLFVESKAVGAFGGGIFGVTLQGGANWAF